MAAARRGKKKTVVKVELGWGGLCSLSVVVFCIFLWMFLLGLWTGQSILAPAPELAAAEPALLPVSGAKSPVWLSAGTSVGPATVAWIMLT